VFDIKIDWLCFYVKNLSVKIFNIVFLFVYNLDEGQQKPDQKSGLLKAVKSHLSAIDY